MQANWRNKIIWWVITLSGALAFVAFTLIVKFVDVQTVAATGSTIGCSTLNQSFYAWCGGNYVCKIISDVLGYLTLALVFIPLILQIVQFVRHKSYRAVDLNLWFTDAILMGLAGIYALFELIAINYRPTLVHDALKASYPSTHTMLFVVILSLTIFEVWHYLRNKPLKITLTVLLAAMMITGIVLRVCSGVHWLTDIIAGIIAGTTLLAGYITLNKTFNQGGNKA